MVVLAEEDTIVPVENVAAYLRGAQQGGEASSSESESPATRTADRGTRAIRQVVTLQGQRHGQFLVNEQARERVLSAVADAQAWASGRLQAQTESLPSWAALLAATPKAESSPFPQMAREEAFALS